MNNTLSQELADRIRSKAVQKMPAFGAGRDKLCSQLDIDWCVLQLMREAADATAKPVATLNRRRNDNHFVLLGEAINLPDGDYQLFTTPRPTPEHTAVPMSDEDAAEQYRNGWLAGEQSAKADAARLEWLATNQGQVACVNDKWFYISGEMEFAEAENMRDAIDKARAKAELAAKARLGNQA